MPASRRGAALVALCIGLLPPAGLGAHASELLVMPYTCTVSGGVPMLTPGPEQGYRVIGRREQRRFSACSPVNPDLCRSWTVYRFDLDCDGARVPWVQIVAAADQSSRRAWLLDGRLHLRMGPRWSLEAHDSCAQEPDVEGRFAGRRMRRYCARRLAMAPPPLVGMPFGFAPMLGIGGIFVAAAPPGVGAAPPPIAAGPPPAEETDDAGPGERMPRAEAPLPWLDPLAKEEPAEPPPPATAESAGAPPSGKAEPAAPPGPEPRVPPKAEDRPRKAAADPPPPAKAAPAGRPAPASKLAVAPTPKVAVAPPPPPPPPKRSPPPSTETTAEPGGSSITLNPFSVLRPTTLGAIVGFAGLALGLLAAFALARRRERLRHANMAPRDIASHSLDGGRAKPAARHARGQVPPKAPAPAMSRVPGASVAAGPLVDLGKRMPATRAEAFQVLGVGITPDAAEAAIKKIVDGLRMSWHPDFAKDEADRRLRELRSKQINAAWEILRRQRAEV